METDFLKFVAGSGATGLLCAWLLQELKKSGWRLFAWLGTDASKAKANFITSTIFAALGAFAYDPLGCAEAHQVLLCGGHQVFTSIPRRFRREFRSPNGTAQTIASGMPEPRR